MRTLVDCKLIAIVLLVTAGCTNRPVTQTVQPTPSITAKAVINPPPLCTNLLPVCDGGLLPQTASVDQINLYIETFLPDWTDANPVLGCRFIAPPRCATGQVTTCVDPCTP